MENLYIHGKSLQYVDRNSEKIGEMKSFNCHRRVFIPFKSESESSDTRKNSAIPHKRSCSAEIIEPTKHKTRILKRPKKFKNYYTDRQPLTITCFDFPRLGEQFLFRGRQTLCKYYNHNEIINEKLIQIKSAETVSEFEKILNNRFRNIGNNRSIEPYYDASAILAPSLKPLANETCLCTKDYYRLNNYILEKKESQHSRRITPLSNEATTSNAIKSFTNGNSSIENFIYLASECYNKCIQNYLNTLNDCNQKFELNIKRQSSTGHQYIETTETLASPKYISSKKDSDKRQVSETTKKESLINHLNKLNINIHHTSNFDDTTTETKETSTIEEIGQSIQIYSKCLSQAMNCSDTNNNNSESTNHIKDPPKIIFSDFSTTAKQPKQDNSDKDYSDNRSAIDKSYLAIPNSKYCSEARPP